MLTYVYASLFESPAQTLVNTVNTVGVMGKGVAKTFREKFPAMFKEYRALCDAGRLRIDTLHLWKGPERWVLNFPTKTTWRMPSKLDYIEQGLNTFVRNYEDMGIVSASFPPLGCGNGNLNWTEVRPLMERYLNKINIPIYVHNVHVGAEFVPEHREPQAAPTTFGQFWNDLRVSLHENKGSFATTETGGLYSIQLKDHELGIERGGRSRERIPLEELENVWVTLREGILSVDRFSTETSRRYKSYLFPLLKSLPYVRSAQVSRVGKEGTVKSEGLYFVRQAEPVREAGRAEYKQECLSL